MLQALLLSYVALSLVSLATMAVAMRNAPIVDPSSPFLDGDCTQEEFEKMLKKWIRTH